MKRLLQLEPPKWPEPTPSLKPTVTVERVKPSVADRPDRTFQNSKENDMNRTLRSIVIATLFLMGTAVQAQALFETPNVYGTVTFIHSDPESGTTRLAHAPMNNSPGAVTLSGTERATHVIVDVEGTSYTFVLAETGVNKHSIVVAVPQVPGAPPLGQDGHASLAELFDSLVVDPTLLARLGSSALAGQ